MGLCEIKSELFWEGKESVLFLNPRLQKEKQEHIKKEIQAYLGEESVWIKSSGTESSQEGKDKLVKLSKKAVLAAAKSVNAFYEVSKEDIWLNTLPVFHIGGLAIFARSYLSGSKVINLEKWSVEDCFQSIEKNKISLISLVPTQVYDLLQLGLRAPKSLRLAIVGGGALSESLYNQAKDLGWPLVPSYGMTETCALMAGAELSSLRANENPRLKILSHIQLKKENQSYICFSESLFQGYLLIGKQDVIWVPQEGGFRIDDRLEVTDGYLKVLGRETDLVKILGETVDISFLEKKIQESLPDKNRRVAIVAKPHDRRGYDLEAFIEGAVLNFKLEEFNKIVMPYERLSKITYKKSFPTSELGKILKHQLT